VRSLRRGITRSRGRRCDESATQAYQDAHGDGDAGWGVGVEGRWNGDAGVDGDAYMDTDWGTHKCAYVEFRTRAWMRTLTGTVTRHKI
jgi:hypothetical protein